MATIEIQVTKINKILIERGLTQTDLFELIKSNGNSIGKDRINRIDRMGIPFLPDKYK